MIFFPQDIGNTLWALATLSWKNEAALTAISKRGFDTAVTFDQQSHGWANGVAGDVFLLFFSWDILMVNDG